MFSSFVQVLQYDYFGLFILVSVLLSCAVVVFSFLSQYTLIIIEDIKWYIFIYHFHGRTSTRNHLCLFHPWNSNVRLDIFHFKRRFIKGLTTKDHPLYGTFCSKLSSCIFEWDSVDYAHLREAKKQELRKNLKGMEPSLKQITAAISSNEIAKHCRRKPSEVSAMKILIDQLLANMWDHTDTNML